MRARIGGGEFAALVQFDPPMLLTGRKMEELEALGSRMAMATRRRRDHIETLAEYIKLLSHMAAFDGLDLAKLDLFARTFFTPCR